MLYDVQTYFVHVNYDWPNNVHLEDRKNAKKHVLAHNIFKQHWHKYDIYNKSACKCIFIDCRTSGDKTSSFVIERT